ncbi:MAG: phosphoribosylglycinamide formyltransferase [Paramuribaculum sp.]|nr:phosphoribosylglycinamide formyltransferase [Paramuribaculum sp.]
MKKIAIFASGNGSNAENIIRYFRDNPNAAEVVLVVCNKPDAAVVKRAENLGVPVKIISKADFQNQDIVLELLKEAKIDIIILAGFLLMVPQYLTEHYKDRIINIHPSLLPAYGGKGMYGRHVHEAVVAAGETETGITIHLVTDKCDEGAILFQVKTGISPEDTPQSVEAKIHRLEKEHFPRLIELFIHDLGQDTMH